MIHVVTTADTEILALARAAETLPADFPPLRAANPARDPDAAAPADGCRLVITRLLGGRRAWPQGFDALAAAAEAAGIPFVALGGEREPDAESTARSRAPGGTVLALHEYLAHGGVENWAQALRFAADTLLLTGFGFDPPAPLPETGVSRDTVTEGRPGVGVVYYRTHWMSGNTDFVDDLATALEKRGCGVRAVYTYSLRPDAAARVPALDLLSDCDAVVTTVLAMGGTPGTPDTPGTPGTPGTEEWTVPALEALDVPVVQAICATRPAAQWEASDAGLTPLDAAMTVALPEFDGRVITVPFSHKEDVDSALGTTVTAYRTVPDRVERVAGITARLARLRHKPNGEKRVAVVLSNYPTKAARIGNAVGLDTPASVVELLGALGAAGYDLGAPAGGPAGGDDLVRRLVAAGAHDAEFLTEAQLAAAPARVPAPRAAAWLDTRVGAAAAAGMRAHWGDPPGAVRRHGDDLVVAGIECGNVFVALQPPRGFGENPVAIYHDPDLPPPHHYLAAYRWLDEVWGADAVVHAGKHGTLEWLPGKGVGLSADCYPDGVLGDVPLFYPFVVNDPGEGTQAKRRAHAVVVDHLVPPMTRAETYDDLARLETLLDDYAQLQALDPTKLAALRAEIWDLVVSANLHTDLGRDAGAPDADGFDDFVLHLDGYLCEVKDLQIRDGLHVLGRPPEGEQERGLVAALLRLPNGDVPGLPAALGLPAEPTRAEADAVAAETAVLLDRLQSTGWDPAAVDALVPDTDPDVRRVLRFACTDVVPRLRASTAEVANLLAGLDGRFVPPGPSGAPTRGGVHVLPTGRNFYGVDPKAVPSRQAWDVGRRLADDLCARYRADHGNWPGQVAIVVWGTANMRTGGDDVAEILALMGVAPVWAPESRRVAGVELVPAAELGRPRVDVTVRISGFFRDAFPHVVELLDDAARLVAGAEPELGWDPAEPRIFGSKPGAYGAGILPLVDAGTWRDDSDLAEVYTTWGGYAYGRGRAGEAAFDAMARRFSAVQVAVKNQDNREHDLFDSDDYFQYHGGMVATIRHLAGRAPEAYFGDSADPARVRTRTLAEEAARVVRARVLNPKWIRAMRRHGYKGAFELAATVDYMFGYDATTGVVEDWMYEKLTEAYVGDPEVREFMAESNPWALTAICDRLLEAADRGLWEAPSPEAVATLQRERLLAEGDLEEQM